MHFLGGRVQRESLHLKEVVLYPDGKGIMIEPPAQLARAVRRGGKVDPTIRPRWWRYVLLRRNLDGVIEWFENDTLRGTYAESEVEVFDRAFSVAYQTARYDTNTVLLAEVKVSPNRPVSDLIHFLNHLDLIREVIPGLSITEYQRTPLLSLDHLRYMDLLERQNRGRPSPRSICAGYMPLPKPDSAFNKEPVFGKEFEEIVDVLNPLPPIKTHLGK
jgi:hypothetical protein